MKNLKKVIGVLLAVVLGLVFATASVLAATTASTTVTQTVTAGALTITAPATASMGTVTVSTAQQTTTGVIGDATDTNLVGVNVIDTRGGGAGWSATIKSTHFTYLATDKMLVGTLDTVTFSGVYDGLLGPSDPPATFVVNIATAGAVGTATFEWRTVVDGTAGTPTTGVLTASTVSLSNGISVEFAVATYVLGDKWSAAVDSFPYTGLTVAPSAIHVASGGTTGLTVGAGGTFAGTGATSGPLSLMSAAPDHGLGSYWQDAGLSLIIPANSLSGTFTATVTLTVS